MIRLSAAVYLLALALSMAASSRAAAEGTAPKLRVVPEVDLSRYAGTWYEIARLPNWFQRGCTGDVTATYTLKPDGNIEVVNRCREKNGAMKSARGVARKADPKGSAAKLKVRFAPSVLSFLPWVWGDYWIIDLAPDYSYAVVGDPGRKYLWILARQPRLDEGIYRRILADAARQGFDVIRIQRTRREP